MGYLRTLKTMAKRGDGTYIDDQGYLRIGAGPCRGMRVHTLIAMAKLGRALNPDEVVHHKDGNRANPHPDNLEIWDKTYHNAHTSKQYWFLKRLRDYEEQQWREYFESNPHPGELEEVPF